MGWWTDPDLHGREVPLRAASLVKEGGVEHDGLVGIGTLAWLDALGAEEQCGLASHGDHGGALLLSLLPLFSPLRILTGKRASLANSSSLLRFSSLTLSPLSYLASKILNVYVDTL